MEPLILEFLQKNWSKENAEKIILAPVPKNAEGDLALNVFQLTKILKKSPPEILKEVQEILEKCEFLEKTEITGPYLNLFFAPAKFFEAVFRTQIEGKSLKEKNIVLEFSGPNTNKPLHLGHMRNHALGISVANLLEANGASVHRVNIINDRGVHICKSMLAYQLFGNEETPESTGEKSDQFVGSYYRKFETESKKNPELMEEIQKILLKWESGDEEVLDLWKKMNNWTLEGHEKTYIRQGVIFEKSYYESDYYKQGKEIAEMGLKKGAFQKQEDGKIVINLEDKNLGEKVVLRADGTSIYLTNDLAVAVARDKDFNHPDELIYTVADEQNYYFKTLFESLSRLGVIDVTKCYHLSYGLVNLPDGRMKSREGTVVDADDLMDELQNIAIEKIKENHSNNSSPSQGRLGGVVGFSEPEIQKISDQIQNAAWKFFLLKTSPVKSITFDKKKSIDFQGATGPYLQYAGVRIKSILNKYHDSSPVQGKLGGVEKDLIKNLGNPEKPLGVKVLEWQKILSRAGKEKNPTYIVTYLLELAQTWSSFYAENSVLNAETEELKNARILLAQKVLSILEKGLNILGIEVPEKM